MARRPSEGSIPTVHTQEGSPHEASEIILRDNAVQFGGLAAGAGFEQVAYITVPMLNVPDGTTIIVRMLDAVEVLPELEGVTKKFPGDHFASRIAATNGDVRLFTWTSVFMKEMEKAYPNQSYVGKWFQITIEGLKRGKKYRVPAIIEVRPSRQAG